jgi:hypothetical protein
MDKVLYGTCCNYAYTVLCRLNITEYKSQDIVNEFFFENEVTFSNYKEHIYKTIKSLKIKPLKRFITEYTPKAIHIDEMQSQCIKCGEIKPIDYFYLFRFKPVKKCKECTTYEQKREYKINSANRLLHKRNKDIAKIDELINLLNEKKQEILNNNLKTN